MKSRLRLAETPFLAATLAMELRLVLPWVFDGPVEDGRQVVEIGLVQPWAVSETGMDASLQLAGQAGVTPEGVTQQ